MSIYRSLRIVLLAAVAALIPAASFGGVFISVNFAPPVLPVYVQPPCPDPGLMWVPGYWAYGEDGYYWVPGTWVPAPYEGALWTPPYWGWDGGLYIFHPGYWGMHVGYYGGVNYGFGYMGVGFVGGLWRGHDFVYNTAIMRVDDRRVHNVYVDRDVVRRYTVVNDRHISFSGGRDGIHHDPLPEERFADRDRHTAETNFQQSHENSARSDHSYYARSNGGHPNNVVMQHPMGQGPNSFGSNGGGFNGRSNSNQRPGNPGDSRSNVRPYDNRGAYNPPPNSGNQGRNNSPQAGDQRPQFRNNTPPQQNNPAPQNRGYNNGHGNQDNMQNRGGPPPQQQQPRSNDGGRGDHGDHGDHGHGR